MKISKVTKFILTTISAVSMLVLSQSTYADVSRTIQVHDSNSRQQSNKDIEFVSLDVEKSKSAYQVNENIRFDVSGNRNYYLYVFSYDSDTNELNSVLSNVNTDSNYMFADKHYNIPGSVDFRSDRKGQEDFIFVGTKQFFDLENKAELKRLRKAVTKEVGDGDITRTILTSKPELKKVSVYVN